jgi:hypothetical protein
MPVCMPSRTDDRHGARVGASPAGRCRSRRPPPEPLDCRSRLVYARQHVNGPDAQPHGDLVCSGEHRATDLACLLLPIWGGEREGADPLGVIAEQIAQTPRVGMARRELRCDIAGTGIGQTMPGPAADPGSPARPVHRLACLKTLLTVSAIIFAYKSLQYKGLSFLFRSPCRSTDRGPIWLPADPSGARRKNSSR